ncbi:MAG TPA: carboxypeptidase-like regulatory domain-containing protein [Microlunatus sp.]
MRDPEGNPVAGVTITLDPPGSGPARTAVTQSDGTYLFGNVLASEGYTLTATPPEDTTVDGPITFTVPPDTEDPITDQDFVVTPNPTGTASGSVTEGDENGPGRSGVRIDIVGPDDARTRWSPTTTVSGRCQMPPGDYTATITPPSGTAVVGVASRDCTIPPTGGAAPGQNFVLVQTYSAGGRVTDDDDQPIAGVDVVITDPASNTSQTVTTDPDGEWVVDGSAARKRLRGYGDDARRL